MSNKTKVLIGLLVLLTLMIFGVIAFWPSSHPSNEGKPVPPQNQADINSPSVAPAAGQNQNENTKTGIANPASVNCVQKGGQLEIRTGPNGGQVGYCMFPDGSSCEEWQFFRGECQPKRPANSNDNTPQQY